MKRTIAVAAVAAATVATACSSPAPEPTAPGDAVVIDKSWQVIGIYTAPDAPSTISDSTPQVPSFTLGPRGMVGTTGCATFRARASFSNDNQPANVNEADSLHIDAIEFGPQSGDCVGAALWAHNHLTRLLAEGHEFGMTVDTTNQLVLTLRDGKVDSPAIRAASLNRVDA